MLQLSKGSKVNAAIVDHIFVPNQTNTNQT